MPWAELIAPAIAHAKRGLHVDWYAALIIASATRELAMDPDAAALFLDDGRWPKGSGWTALADIAARPVAPCRHARADRQRRAARPLRGRHRRGLRARRDRQGRVHDRASDLRRLPRRLARPAGNSVPRWRGSGRCRASPPGRRWPMRWRAGRQAIGAVDAASPAAHAARAEALAAAYRHPPCHHGRPREPQGAGLHHPFLDRRPAGQHGGDDPDAAVDLRRRGASRPRPAC